MEFTTKEFGGLTLRVDLMPKNVNPLEYFPCLSIYPEFRVKLDPQLKIGKIIRYIGYLYQEKTPLIVIDNFLRREVEAAKLAGFDKNQNGSIKKGYQQVMNGENPDVNRMIICWCKMLRQTLFAKLAVYQKTYYNELESLMEPDSGDKAKIRTNINNFGEDIDHIINTILVDDSSKMLVADLLDDIEDDELELRPEDLARKRKFKKKLVDIEPYGKSYKVPFEKYKDEASPGA